MYHSKLPWKIAKSHRGIVYVNSDIDYTIVSEHSLATGREDAEFIVKACNEYYTLKAKAELLGKLQASVKVLSNAGLSDTKFCLLTTRLLADAFARAKELSK